LIFTAAPDIMRHWWPQTMINGGEFLVLRMNKKIAGNVVACLLFAQGVWAGNQGIVFVGQSYWVHYSSVTLETLMSDLEDALQITITGLSGRQSEHLSFSFTARSGEAVLKKMLQAIGEKNYALIYQGSRLKALCVVPESARSIAWPKEGAGADAAPDRDPEKIYGARVTAIDSKEDLFSEPLKAGDIIVAYDGVSITRGPLELTQVMAERSADETVEIGIVREGVPMNLFVRGGMMNAGLKTVLLDRGSL
jgi:hypothetical protein